MDTLTKAKEYIKDAEGAYGREDELKMIQELVDLVEDLKDEFLYGKEDNEEST
jgi:hypothetical protein